MSLVSELNQRKVFKVGAAYLVIGWLAVQAASIGFPAFDAPPWALRVFIFVVLLGFPVALVMSWMLVVTPEGVRVEPARFGNKRLYAVAAILAALAITWYFRGKPDIRVPGEDLRSIAVLPFVNMSGEADNEYFSDGISEEILNVLARTPDLRVAARTSSFAFKGQAKEIPDIARELEVRMVLEGSVRRQGERVRITAQLIDASNGFHLWSQTYDRELKDIFAIQDEIAKAIAQELDVKLGGSSGTAAPRADTTDLEAYDLYLRGVALWQARGEANLREADRLFRAALARDANLAKAWAGLALTHAVLPEWSGVKSTEAFPVARDAAEHALALDPKLPEPHAVLGYVAGAELRFGTMRAMLQRAITLAPSYATGHQWYGEALNIDGRHDEALPFLRKAIELDPKSAVVRSAYALTLSFAGQDKEALEVCGTILAEDPDWVLCRMLRFDRALLDKDNAAARAELLRMATPRGAEAIAFANAMMDVVEGSGDADAVASRLARMPDGFTDASGPTPLAPNDAMLWFMAIGRNDLAIARYALYAQSLPYLARVYAFDTHLRPLACEPGFQATLRTLAVEDARIAAMCDGHPPTD